MVAAAAEDRAKGKRKKVFFISPAICLKEGNWIGIPYNKD